jgi:hypothetical protein
MKVKALVDGVETAIPVIFNFKQGYITLRPTIDDVEVEMKFDWTTIVELGNTAKQRERVQLLMRQKKK